MENLICWQDSTEVQAFMKQQNIPNVTALRNFYETTVQQVRPRFLWKGGGVVVLAAAQWWQRLEWDRGRAPVSTAAPAARS